MTLFDYYLQYMTELLEGKRPAPEGITLPEGGEAKRVQSLGQQLQAMGMASFVRACAAQDGTELPPSLFDDDGLADFGAFLQNAGQTAPDPKPPESAQEDAAGDPDADKHAFEVFLDCIAMDDGLVQYLIDVLKRMDRKEFFKLSQITTKLDLDPEEFLYWLAHRQDYAGEEEPPSWTVLCCVWRRRGGWMWPPRCSAATKEPLRHSAVRLPSWYICLPPPSRGTKKTIWIGTTPSGSSCA